MVAERTHDQREIAIRDRVLFEGDVRGRPIRLDSLVLKVAAEELWLGLSDPEPSLALFRADQPIRLTLTEEGAARLGGSSFLRTLAGDPPRIFAVRRPEFELVQRRVYRRYELDAPIRFRQLDPISKEPRGRSATASAVNVSLGGMLLRTPAAVSVGDEVDMTLPLGGGNHISAGNRVVRVRAIPTPNIPGQPVVLEVGTRFTRITSADQELLVRMALAADRRRRLAAEAMGLRA